MKPIFDFDYSGLITSQSIHTPIIFRQMQKRAQIGWHPYVFLHGRHLLEAGVGRRSGERFAAEHHRRR